MRRTEKGNGPEGLGEAVRNYIVDYVCPECGEPHRVSDDFRLSGGPAEAGSLDDAFPKGDLPAEVVALLGDLVWCGETAEWLDLDDPARVFLTPQGVRAGGALPGPGPGRG